MWVNREAEDGGGTVSVFPGWMFIEFTCGDCGHHWFGVAAVGAHGLECPGCHRVDPEYVWYPDDDDPNKPEMAHDGCWLTGELNVPEFWPDDDEDEYEDDAATTPWYIRVLAFLMALATLHYARSMDHGRD